MAKKDPPPNPAEVAQQLTEAIITLSEAFEPINEAVNGYKAARMAEGWSCASAESMAVAYHSLLISQVIAAGVQ